MNNTSIAMNKDALRERGWTKPLAVAAAVAFAVMPFLVADYLVFQATLILSYAIAVLGLNILVGYNGQISLGHGAFYAAGAYCTAMTTQILGVPYWLTVPVAGVVCFAVGFLLGFPALRLSGHYLALATFALALATPQLLKYKRIESWTGGVQGIVLDKPPAPFKFSFLGTDFNEDRWVYLLTLLAAIALFWAASNLLSGRIGRALIAIRDHPVAASAMGINLPMVKSIAFGISAGYTGVAGALGALAVGFVSPDSFPGFLSITLLVGVVVGGLASVPGALFGAIFIMLVPNLAEQVSKSAPSAIYAVLLITLMLVMPGGVMGAVRRLLNLRKSP